jgi:hypothetical protein
MYMKFVGAVLVVWLVILGSIATAWGINLSKLIKCDWDNDNYKYEVVHCIGIIPPAALVTVWFGTDAKEDAK